MKYDRTLLNALSEGICLVDKNDNITFCNRRLETWLGQKTDSMRGQKLAHLFPRFAKPHVSARLAMVRTLKSPVIFSPQIHGYLFPCPLNDGEYRFMQTTVTYLEDECLLLSVQDFTEQMRQSKLQKENQRRLQKELLQRYALENQNAQLIAAIDQAPEAIMICNERACVQYVNQTFVKQTGWTQNEALRKKLYSQFRDDNDTEFEERLLETIRSGTQWQGQYQVQRKDGTHFTSNLSIAPIVNPEGDVSHAVAIQEDITQYILMEEQYRQTQKQEALTTLVGGIAHDFNNLLSGMLGHLYLASREVKALPKTPARLDKIQQAAYEAADIVKQLMTFSRRDQIETRNFPLQSFLKEMVKLLEHNVPENVEFTLDFEAYPFPMHGDAELLQQSMMNMVQNSVAACADVEHPKIHISLSMLDIHKDENLVVRYPALQYGEYADLSISDNGSGIHPDHHERIFDPFFTTKQLGSGLGLATVMGFIRHHHGVIDVDSTLNQGTTFHMYLPLCARHDSEESAPLDAASESCILLVDDDPLVRETTQEFLLDLGHEVVTAVDGQEAVDIFEKDSKRFDVIIMDMVMPRMNGLAAMRYIRALNDDVPVIFATAYDRSLSMEDAEKFERSMLVSKPFNPEDLNHLIGQIQQK